MGVGWHCYIGGFGRETRILASESASALTLPLPRPFLFGLSPAWVDSPLTEMEAGRDCLQALWESPCRKRLMMAVDKGAHLLRSVVWGTEPWPPLGASLETLGPLAPSVSLPLAVEPASCSLDLSFPNWKNEGFREVTS